MEHHRNGMGEVEGGVAGVAVQLNHPLAEQQLIVGQAPVLPPEHQRRPRAVAVRCFRSVQQPGQHLFRRMQGNLAMVEPSAGGHDPPAVRQGTDQVGVTASLLEYRQTVHGHALSLGVSAGAARCHQA